LQGVQLLCREFEVLLIIDDIQAGCGRSGQFFSFELAGLTPDIVCLSKSISGYGLPLSLVLIRPDIDCLRPGEHTGTFRGNNHAFVTGREALNFWNDDAFQADVSRRIAITSEFLDRISALFSPGSVTLKGRGLMRGLQVPSGGLAHKLSRSLFDRGIIAETSGPGGEVLKLLPPLTIEMELLEESFLLIEHVATEILSVAPY
jgi:diaminobutyrate-2-oxoglutarate transaminase